MGAQQGGTEEKLNQMRWKQEQRRLCVTEERSGISRLHQSCVCQRTCLIGFLRVWHEDGKKKKKRKNKVAARLKARSKAETNNNNNNNNPSVPVLSASVCLCHRAAPLCVCVCVLCVPVCSGAEDGRGTHAESRCLPPPGGPLRGRGGGGGGGGEGRGGASCQSCR